ncbi:MAG: hypothetical protein ACRCTQ_03495 [Brevinemataceae bacterium]
MLFVLVLLLTSCSVLDSQSQNLVDEKESVIVDKGIVDKSIQQPSIEKIFIKKLAGKYVQCRSPFNGGKYLMYLSYRATFRANGDFHNRL